MVVDASVWVSLFVDSDAFHGQTRGWFQSARESREGLAVPTSALPEVAGAVARRVNNSQRGVSAAETILEFASVSVFDLSLPRARLALELAAHTRLKGMDAIYVSLARELSAGLLTWDDGQLRRAASLIAVTTPT